MRPAFYPLAIFFGAALLGRAPTTAHADTASYQAVDWDKEIDLPPGAYRAIKPIDLNGDFTVKTEASTLVDGVAFLARSGVQHWHVEGALFRRVRMTVKRNGSGHGIDSVFEDFDFNKDDNWYNFWWSTRWNFDNCIFTKKLLRGELTPLDYAVHAWRCTFYGVKLPAVGFKENPANYLGKGDLGFEKCRFVDCDVPQTFLAATVDCVFEGCRFEPKARLTWPKETTAIQVHAYYDGTGNTPASFINGPLTVAFEPVPRGGEFGSTLPHSQSAGRVTLTNQHLSGQFVQLGTVPKKASEIVDVPVAAGGVSPAPVPASNPAAVSTASVPAPAVAAVSVVHGLEEMLRVLPARLELRVGGEPSAPGIEAANVILAKNFVGHPVSMRITPTGVQAVSGQGYAYQANGRWQDVLYHDATIPACAVALFPAANAAALAKVPPKSEFPLAGTVSKAEIVARGEAMSFVVYVAGARVQDSLVVLHPDIPAGAAAASGEAQVIGAWTVLFHPDGNHWEQTFNADHTSTRDGGRFGTWEVKDNHFIIHLDSNGIDTYNLPMRDGVMYGQNLDGEHLTLARPDLPTPAALQAQVVGRWNFDNHAGDGFHASYSLNADRTFTEGERLVGHWFTLGNAVVFKWEGHGEWHDMFELPGANGVLPGVNGFRNELTLTRVGMAAPLKTVPSKVGDSYFGRRSGPP